MTLHRVIVFLQELNAMANLLLTLGIISSLWFAVLLFMYFKAVRVLTRYGVRLGADVDPAAVWEHVAPTCIQVYYQVYLPSPTNHQPNFQRDMAILRDKFAFKWRNEYERLQMTRIFSETTTDTADHKEKRTVLTQQFQQASDIPQSAYSGATLLKAPECLSWSSPRSRNADKRSSYQHENHKNFIPTPSGHQFPSTPLSSRSSSSKLIHRITVTGGLDRPKSRPR
ncbi:uncharacterized protein LOC110862332 [Folsomia candida]|uniref:Uncharacterized protein n=1 Tax=Folsomia candida TaxID=158441 RepID=A0A226CYN3_FOLCA|nr:uncharacterized protein LOC110862332 [Folsomia candida]OXA37648.1 hypothetical protein Fcan01_27575 [Folsomia candida]